MLFFHCERTGFPNQDAGPEAHGERGRAAPI
jgi:hypothetical protein